MNFKISSQDLPGGPVVKNSPCNSGNAGLLPGQRTKISRTVEQRSPCTQLLSPCAPTRESVCTNDPT